MEAAQARLEAAREVVAEINARLRHENIMAEVIIQASPGHGKTSWCNRGQLLFSSDPVLRLEQPSDRHVTTKFTKNFYKGKSLSLPLLNADTAV